MGDQTFPICVACGTQYEALKDGKTNLDNCKICDDPRQFIPPTGQQWTTLNELRKHHENKWQQDSVNEKLWFVTTEPKFGIGQRATLLQTPQGNILWDCIACLDEATKEFIDSKGGLKAIVISHPHFYTTHTEWAKAFNCPIYVAKHDTEWLARKGKHLRFVSGKTETILPGVTAIVCGGHFPGSLVLHWEKTLLIADTLMTVPSAYSPHPRPPGQTTYSFMWSIPNMIPLAPDAIIQIWRALEPFEFDTTHAIFTGMDVRDKDLKKRVLESVKIQIRKEGYEDHDIFREGL